jgi:rubredoxin
MGLFSKLFSRNKEAEAPAAGGYRVLSASSEEVNRHSEEMGEMYFDCPKCNAAQRINNIGKMMLKANPAAFSSMKCSKCGHMFDAGPRVKFGKCPGFDYTNA